MSSENVERTRLLLELSERDDFEAALELLDAQVAAFPLVSAFEGGYHGHEGIREWWQTLRESFLDYVVDVVELRDLGRPDARGPVLPRPRRGEQLAVRAARLVPGRLARRQGTLAARLRQRGRGAGGRKREHVVIRRSRRPAAAAAWRLTAVARARALRTASLSVSTSYAPRWRTPLMKKLGVPATPLASALATSSATRPAYSWRTQILMEAVHIEAQLLGAAHEVARRELVLVAEQRVVHLPERALRAGRLGRLGGELRVGCGRR